MSQSPVMRVMLLCKKQSRGLILVLLITTFGALCKAVFAQLWGEAVNYGIAGAYKTAAAVIAASVLVNLFDGLHTALNFRVSAKTVEAMFRELRKKAFDMINHAAVPELEKKMNASDVASRMNTDLDILSDFFSERIIWIIRLCLQGGISAIICFFISWQLSAAYFILMPFSIWLLQRLSSKIRTQRTNASESMGRAMGFFGEMHRALLTVRTYEMQEVMNQRFGSAVDAAYQENVGTEKIAVKMNLVNMTVTVVQMIILFGFGMYLVQRGTVSVGQVVSFVSLSGYARTAFESMEAMLRYARTASAVAGRIVEVFDILPEEGSTQTQKEEKLPDRNTKDVVRLSGVKFHYLEGCPVLQGVDLCVKRGQKVGLIGASGCGKSTVFKLLCRFYQHTAGEARLFGKDIQRWEPDEVRKNIAVVTQDASLFDGTVAENLSYGRGFEGSGSVTCQELETVLREVDLWNFISEQPLGLQTEVGESGSHLSGGQKQRLCIARAMLKKPELVLLDEATSALDTQSENIVQASLERLLDGRAALVIAHRIRTIRNMDYIYCMDAGRVIEEGTPDELLERRGYFYKMYRMQEEEQKEEQERQDETGEGSIQDERN